MLEISNYQVLVISFNQTFILTFKIWKDLKLMHDLFFSKYFKTIVLIPFIIVL